MRVTVIIIGLIFCLCYGSAFAKKKTTQHRAVSQTINGTPQLAAEINQIVQSLDHKAEVGIVIKSMKYGDTFYTKNQYQLFTPASVMKILVAEAALLYLGPDYKFPTTLLTDAVDTTDGVIKGNVYLIQTGDPTLTYDDLTDLMVSVKTQSIQTITGNVVIDNTAYDDSHFGPGWMFDDKRYCFSAPISASIINHNCLYLKVVPGKKVGEYATVVQSPRYFYGVIKNSVMTKASKARCGLQLDTQSNVISLTGCIPKSKGPWGVSIVIADINEYNKALLRNLMQRYGIHVQGQVIQGNAPTHLRSIAIHESEPLYILINEMLKTSNNVIAGSIFKKLGEFYSRAPGSWNNGGEAVKQILAQKAGVDTRDMAEIDGSGLSQSNRIKPLQMMQVLDFAYHHYATNVEFISALPISGVDGTLKHRLGQITRKVRAKTGTLAESGVVALAGYVISKEKEPIAFVIMVNGHSGNVWQYRELEDKIVMALTNYKRS